MDIFDTFWNLFFCVRANFATPSFFSLLKQSMSPYTSGVEAAKPNCSVESTNLDASTGACLQEGTNGISTSSCFSGGQASASSLSVGLRKPALPGSDYEKQTEEDASLVHVYNSSKLQAW